MNAILSKRPRTKRVYELPPLSLLADGPTPAVVPSADISSTALALELAFADFKVGIRAVVSCRGPTVTQYEFELLDPGMRVGKLISYEKDLDLKLGVSGIRIVAPLKNKKTIGIEIPNAVSSVVNLKALLVGSNVMDMELPICIGASATGNP
jgi:DNA segregation ATPase FtsK/SpoIIIE-like protein